jgi:hypothetical protein
MADAGGLTVLVNSSDGFEDTWVPFFRLFATYWPDCSYPIVLNTERKILEFPGLAIRSTQAALGATRRLTWSECLMRCLDGLDTDRILYLQDDFFLFGPVRGDLVERFDRLMRDESIDNIRLTECDGSGPWHPTANPLLWEVDRRATYRIALQAGLWRTSYLRALLRKHESPWQLEIFGSRRARRRNDRVFCVNRDRFMRAGEEIVPYRPTGIVKGKWDREVVVDLFSSHGIEVDFSRRGFYERGVDRPRRPPLAKRLLDRVRSAV